MHFPLVPAYTGPSHLGGSAAGGDDNKRATFRGGRFGQGLAGGRLPTLWGDVSLTAFSAAGGPAPGREKAPPLALAPAHAPAAPDGYVLSLARWARGLGPRAAAALRARAAAAADPLPLRLPLLPLFPAPTARPLLAGAAPLHGTPVKESAPRAKGGTPRAQAGTPRKRG